jgi:hypothetical protein
MPDASPAMSLSQDEAVKSKASDRGPTGKHRDAINKLFIPVVGYADNTNHVKL